MVALYTIWGERRTHAGVWRGVGLPSAGTLEELPADAGQGASQATQAAQALTCSTTKHTYTCEHAILRQLTHKQIKGSREGAHPHLGSRGTERWLSVV
jgi:hypothetical protein